MNWCIYILILITTATVAAMERTPVVGGILDFLAVVCLLMPLAICLLNETDTKQTNDWRPMDAEERMHMQLYSSPGGRSRSGYRY